MNLITTTFRVRRIEKQDETRWRHLWDIYTRFYNREPIEIVTWSTWTRIMDPVTPLHAIVAEKVNGENAEIVGIANYTIQDNTSFVSPSCYLADLIVEEDHRGLGVGGLLIDWLLAEMKEKKWARLYWHTRENNYRARALYDKFTPHSGFLRYAIEDSAAAVAVEENEDRPRSLGSQCSSERCRRYSS